MNKVSLSEKIRSEFRVDSRSSSLRNVICGVGVNDSDYIVSPRINGRQVRCPAYDLWVSMIQRCYGESQLKTRPTYHSVEVCDEWKSFMSFRSWWIDNYTDGWQLDKDIIGMESGVYSPASCIFIPQWLNSFLCSQEKRRGDWPIGVSYCKDRGLYSSYCRDPIKKRGVMIGRFCTPIEAHKAHIKQKIAHAAALKEMMDEIDKRIYQCVIKIIESREMAA